MNDMIKKLIFLMVLAGLLAWGVATMAQGPSVNPIATGNVTILQGEEIENVQELSRDMLRPVGR